MQWSCYSVINKNIITSFGARAPQVSEKKPCVEKETHHVLSHMYDLDF